MWRPIDTEFYSPRLPVSIVDVEGDGVGLRTLLEAFQCVVHLHSIGTPNDFLKVISQGAAVPRYVIIDGHGTEHGLHFREDTGGIDSPVLKEGCLGPELIRERANLPDATVINLTCLGGERRMADAFLAGRIRAYIGSRTCHDGRAMRLYLANFIYNVTVRNMSDRDAWYRAVRDTDHPDIDLLSFYHPDGREERFSREAVEQAHA